MIYVVGKEMTVKIAIISDTHFGFGRNSNRSEDCWDGGREAFEKAKDCDLILLPGDVFDGRIPRPEDWAKSMEILSKVEAPIVAIHGTHERRGKGLINPIEGLDKAGFLKHIHCSSEVFEIKGKKIAVHGMSGVPESYAKEVLDNWNPKPKKGAYNILLTHQSITPYIYNPKNPPSLRFEDLPKGFDLYVSGHIHWREKSKVHGKPFLIPGSTVTTQINKKESKNPKGFYILEINEEEKIDFVKLERGRKVFYKEFEINHDKVSEINEKIENYLGEIKEDKKPLVRIVVKGGVPKSSNLDFSDIKNKYEDGMILTISKKVSEEKLEKKIKLLQDIKEKKLSVEEMGMNILKENMKEMESSLNYEDIFELLVEGNIDSAKAHLIENLEKERKEKKTKKEGGKKSEKKGLERWVS